MKYIIIISNSDGKVLFKGKPITLPLTSKAVTEKSIELFSDPEPCIIHQSYASQKIIDQFLSMFPVLPITKVALKPYDKKLDFIKIPNIYKCFLSIEVKK